MAGSASFSSSRSITVSAPRNYDVFISFRGEDTRINFTGHLDEALRQKQIKTFIDYELKKGSEILPSLLEIIADSYISVVVFSENYATSTSCLDELNKIMQCRKHQGQVVIPVFYNVDPSHVRKQEGSYKKAFEGYEKDSRHDMNKVQKWKKALTKAANLSGLHSPSRLYRDDAVLIQNIVKEVLQKLNDCPNPPNDSKGHLVGIDKNCAAVELLMREDQSVGIWGMGGIGKTTIARAIFEKSYKEYEGSCFLEYVRERSGENSQGLRNLGNELRSELLREGISQNSTAKYTSDQIRLRREKKLVVLDDVSSSEQVEYLVAQLQPYRRGSRIIITTRDKSVLERAGVKKIHKVEKLDFQESLQLFSWNAFDEKYPPIGYEELAKGAVNYCDGVPLALKVAGSVLHSKTEKECDSALKRLEKIPEKEIQNVLQWSYDDLHDVEKDILLDIACILKGKSKETVFSLLDSCGFYPDIGMKNLQNKALTNIRDGCVWMHDLIQKMGREIVRGKSPKNPEKRSHLWDVDDLWYILKDNKGTDAIESIMLDLSQMRQHLQLSAETFKNMPNLRLLRFYYSSYKFGESCNLYFPTGLESFPDKLRYLEWERYPLKSFPQNFCAELLVVICMSHSYVEELWQGIQDLGNLKEIKLYSCTRLMQLPDLSKASKLESVYLSNCSSLCDLHPSLLSLDSLVTLYVHWCTKLKSLKSEKNLTSLRNIRVEGCKGLKEFSLSSDSIVRLDLSSAGIEVLHLPIGCLRNLKELFLDGSRLNELPDELSSLTSLENLRIDSCKVAINNPKLQVIFDGLLSLKRLGLNDCDSLSELPDNIGKLSSLEYLNLNNCRKLQYLPELPPSIKCLYLVGTGIEVLNSSICCLSNLRELFLDGTRLENIPNELSSLTSLRTLTLTNCEKLQCVPELPPSIMEINADGCTSLVTVSAPKAFAALKKEEYSRYAFSFKDCTKLDGHSLNYIMEGAHLAVMIAAFHSLFKLGYSILDVCCPGSRIPKQFPYRTTETESSINVELPSRYDFQGFLSVVLSIPPHHTIEHGVLTCKCYLEDGTVILDSGWDYDYIKDLNSDHVFTWYFPQDYYSIPVTYEGPVSFVFRFSTSDDEFEEYDNSAFIKECGVWLICVPELRSYLGGLVMEFDKELELYQRTCHGGEYNRLLDSSKDVSESELEASSNSQDVSLGRGRTILTAIEKEGKRRLFGKVYERRTKSRKIEKRGEGDVTSCGVSSGEWVEMEDSVRFE